MECHQKGHVANSDIELMSCARSYCISFTLGSSSLFSTIVLDLLLIFTRSIREPCSVSLMKIGMAKSFLMNAF